MSRTALNASLNKSVRVELVETLPRLAVIVCFMSLSTLAAAQDEPGLRFSGYYKNLLVSSETASGEPYTLDVNRMRLELKGQLSQALRLDVQYDNEVWLGNYLRTTQFQQQKGLPSPQYWIAQGSYADGPTLYGTHGLYRAQLQATFGDTDLRIGRQRIAWGTGRFWSPLDLLNPFSPVSLERGERLGVDAVLVEHKFGPVSRVSAVYAPSRRAGEDSRALQWHGNAQSTDYSVTAGQIRGDKVVGLDLAGQIGAAGVRAEMTRVQPRIGDTYHRFLLGIDYAFANTLTLSAELYRDGSGASSSAAYDVSALTTGRRQTLAQHYAGVRAIYEITPLLKLSADVIVNLDDQSRYLAPGISYSIRSNLDWSLVWRRFSGATGTEYARVPSAVFTQIQWFF